MSSNPETKEGKCKGRRCWTIPFFVLGIVLLKSAAVMVLWNHLIPDLFHGPAVSFLQALGLVVLAKLFVFGGGHRCCGHGRFGPPWKRWAGLSDEERAKLRDEIGGKCS